MNLRGEYLDLQPDNGKDRVTCLEAYNAYFRKYGQAPKLIAFSPGTPLDDHEAAFYRNHNIAVVRLAGVQHGHARVGPVPGREHGDIDD